jgi:hypothetical protein
MVGLTLFAELAAAIACGGLALVLAQVAGLGRNLTMAAVGGAAGFFIGLVTQLGWPFLALPLAAGTMYGLDHWIERTSNAQHLGRDLAPASRQLMR